MHSIEPFFNWRHLYIADEDEQSPFYGREHSEFEFTNTIYNYVIHPQWDDFGSETLFIKILFVDYDEGYCIIEMIGEWNDALTNDIMLLKRDIAEDLMYYGVNKFILIGENILNFHGSDDCYYEEGFEDVEDGWIAAVSFPEFIQEEFKKYNIDNYVNMGGTLQLEKWRTLHPNTFFDIVSGLI